MKTIVKISLLALMLLSQTTILAMNEEDDNKQEVPMQRRPKRMLNNTSTPIHAPGRPVECPVQTYFDMNNLRIEVSSTSYTGIISYSIERENGAEVDNGLINISTALESIDVSNLPQGVYVIWITINDIDFAGEFEII